MSDIEFMIHVLNSFPAEYEVVLDSLETCPMSIREDRLMFEALRNWAQDMKVLLLLLTKVRRNEVRKNWLQDSMCSEIECVATAVNMTWSRLTKVSRESHDWQKPESKRWEFQELFDWEQVLKNPYNGINDSLVITDLIVLKGRKSNKWLTMQWVL